MAWVSFIFGLIALFSLGLYWALQSLVSPTLSVDFANRVILPIMDLSTMIRNMCAVVALVTGIIALVQIKKEVSSEKGKLFAWIGIALGAGWMLFGLLVGVIFTVGEILY